MYSRSSRNPHAAHSVTEPMRPQGGNIILLDLHLVALEVGELVEADLVLHAVLQGGGSGGHVTVHYVWVIRLIKEREYHSE